MFEYRIWLFLLAISVGIASCNEEVDLPEVLVYGHGGAGFSSVHAQHPANSAQSIRQALLLYGADGVEVDIQLTADNQLVLYHDQRLESSTNGIGYVSDFKANELTKKCYRAQIDQYTVYNIILLDDLIRIAKNAKRKIYISLNMHPQFEVEDQVKYRKRFIAALKPYWTNHCNDSICLMFESPDRLFLTELMNTTPWNIGKSSIYYDGSSTVENVQFAWENNLNGLVSNYLNETPESIKMAQSVGLEMVLYGMKLKSDIRKALELKPDKVQTDNIPMTMDYLGR